jgi:hypothetical protein
MLLVPLFAKLFKVKSFENKRTTSCHGFFKLFFALKKACEAFTNKSYQNQAYF